MYFDVKINTNKGPKIICAYSHCGKGREIRSRRSEAGKETDFLINYKLSLIVINTQGIRACGAQFFATDYTDKHR
jgi:hypothetical protein